MISAKPQDLAWVVSVVVVGAVIAAILLNPPGVVRSARSISHRIEDLSSIERATQQYWDRYKSLPTDLATLVKEPGLRVSATDPETGSPYVYETTGPKSYRLCAVRVIRPRGTRTCMARCSRRRRGRHCFDLTIP